MKLYPVFVLLFLGIGCNSDSQEPSKIKNQSVTEAVFNKEKWGIKQGKDYPYRASMLKDVVYNDTIRTLNKEQLLELLGVPDRAENQHLYYTIGQDRLGFFPLTTKTMVVKLKDSIHIDWIKIHE